MALLVLVFCSSMKNFNKWGKTLKRSSVICKQFFKSTSQETRSPAINYICDKVSLFLQQLLYSLFFLFFTYLFILHNKVKREKFFFSV
jgi:hypothetical protein